MTNSPTASDRIDRPQAFLPLEEPVSVRKGEAIHATIMARPGDHVLAWTIELPAQNKQYALSTFNGLLLDDEALNRHLTRIGMLFQGGALIQSMTILENAMLPLREHTKLDWDDADDSGVFKYVRIEFPGYRFQLNNEINGLTMGGVGRGTELHHIQVSYSFDDGYEWFGGTVNASHLVAFGTTDDHFDSDFGFRGRIQYGFGLNDPAVWDPTGETRGFESDNDGSSSSTGEPFTHPLFVNFTVVGPQRTDATIVPPATSADYCAVVRRSSQMSLYNSVIMGWPWGLSLRDAITIQWATDDTLQWRNVSLQGSVEKVAGSGSIMGEDRWSEVTTWFDTPGYNNLGSAPRLPSAIGLSDMSDLNDPNPVPAPGSELIGSADFTNPNLAGFEVVTYRGAFDPAWDMDQQWTAGWTNFDPQNFVYPTPVRDDIGGEIPSQEILVEIYPNPFNPSAIIKFSVPKSGHVTLKVYNVRGHEVAALVDEHMEVGTFEQTFAGAELPSGTYFYSLKGDGFGKTGKMQLVK